MNLSSSPDQIDSHAWLALSLTTLVSFLVVLDVSAVNVAFPSIGADLDASETALSWVISGYNIAIAAFLLIAGRLADRVGRKRVFLPGLAIFMLGSLLSGLAPTVGLLVAARVLQAVGGAVLLPASIAIVLPEFPFAKRSMAIGIWGATGALGAAFGPVVGSLLIEAGSWRYVFLINVPICLFVLAAAPRILRESKDPNATGQMDLIGVPAGTLAVAMIMVAIVQGGSWGWTDARTVGCIVVGLALLPVVIIRSERHPEPLLDLDLFRRYRSFASANLAIAFYAMGFTGGFLLSSLMLQTLWGLSVIETGLALTPSPILSAITSVLTGRVADRYGHRWPLTIGCVIMGASYLGYWFVIGTDPAVLTRFIPLSLVLGVGIGLTIATWFSAAISEVDQARFGIANATLRTVQQVSYAVGISVVIALLAATRATDVLAGFERSWLWVTAMFWIAAVLTALTFPSGSSTDRQAS